MPRPPAMIRYKKSKGTGGIILTERDKKAAEIIHRWHVIKAADLATALCDLGEEVGSLRGLEKRLSMLARITPHALLDRHLYGGFGNQFVGWSITGAGAEWLSTPWPFTGVPNPDRGVHAALAASVGVALEGGGHTVLSEREASTGWDVNGERVEVQVGSPYWASTGRRTDQVPDLIIPGPGGRKIVVEIERRRSRHLRDYRRKLEAYRMDPSVVAVWYLVTAPSILNRVATAADAVFGQQDFPLRIMAIPEEATAEDINPSPLHLEDLRALEAGAAQVV